MAKYAQIETMVREYKSTKDFSKDAEKLARDGWYVSSQTERKPRAGCLRILTLGLFALIFHPKPILVVTYQRQPASSGDAPPPPVAPKSPYG